MNWLNKNYKGLLFCLLIAIPCHFLGKKFPVIGGAVLAILVGSIGCSSSKIYVSFV